MPTTVDGRPIAGAGSPSPSVRRFSALRLTRWTLVRLAIVVAAVVGAKWAVDKYGRDYSFFDMKIYHGAMVWWTSGHDLYQFVAPKTTLGFTYPPFAALVMAPMALLPTMAAGWVNTVLSVAALVLILVWLLVPLADRHGWPRWFVVALAVPLACATEPVRETLGFGQVNLLLAALIYADVVALRNRSAVATSSSGESLTGSPLRRLWTAGTLAGIGIGLAAAIKVTPALFIGYLLVTRQWRTALVASCTALGATLLTFVVMGTDAATYFTSIMFDTGRIGQVDATANQSLAGLLARLYDSPTTPTLMWLAFAMLLLAVGLTRAASAHREGDEVAAFTLVGLTANAVSPISWSHHLVFLVPALVILVDTALRRRSAARGFAPRGAFTRGPGGIPAFAGLSAAVCALGIYVVFVMSPIWRYEHKLQLGVSHYHDGLAGALAENSIALIIIALIALLPWRPGAEPAFYTEPGLARRRAAAAVLPD